MPQTLSFGDLDRLASQPPPAAPPSEPAAKKLSMADLDTLATTPPQKSGFAGFMDSVGKYLSGAKDSNPVSGLADTIRAAATNPGKFIDDTSKRNLQSLDEAKAAWHKGDYSGAALHAFNYLAPGGVALDDMLNDAENGELARSLGKATMFGLTATLAPKVLPAAGAVADAAAATGSRVAGVARNLATNVPAGDLAALGLDAAGMVSPRVAHAISFGKGAVRITKAAQAMLDDSAASQSAAPAPVARAPRRAPAAPAAAPPPAPLVEPVPGYATRPDAIPSNYGVLPALDRSQYFRPLAPGEPPLAQPAPVPGVPVQPPLGAPPPAAPPDLASAATNAAPMSRAQAPPAPPVAAPIPEAPAPDTPAAAPRPEPPTPAATLLEKSRAAHADAREAPVQRVARLKELLDKARKPQRLADAADAQDARTEAAGEAATWANRRAKADRFVKYLKTEQLAPTPENVAKAAKELAEREVPSAETLDMIHDRMNYTAPASEFDDMEPLLKRSIAEANARKAAAADNPPAEPAADALKAKGRAAFERRKKK